MGLTGLKPRCHLAIFLSGGSKENLFSALVWIFGKNSVPRSCGTGSPHFRVSCKVGPLASCVCARACVRVCACACVCVHT